MIYLAFAKVCVLMALIVIFSALFWCEVCRGTGKIEKLCVAFFMIIFTFNFGLFAYEQARLIGNGHARIAWYNLIMMGTSSFVMLFPLIYTWWKIRTERKAKL